MAARKRKMPDHEGTRATVTERANRAISRRGKRSRKQAAASKLNPEAPPAGAAILADVDPALDTESETAASARRATGRDRLTGES